MADQKLSALDTIPAVDRTADLLYIVDTSGGTSNKVTPNTLLGITGAPVGDTDSATLSNKTITAPTISSPILSGTITGTYTIGGTPTFPSAVVTLTGSQTLTNKILTSPTINTPTIVNPTITVDAISEFTSANGVTVDGLNIKDSKLNTNNSVVTANITDAAVTPAKLVAGTGSGWAWQSWTPTWTVLTVGNAVQANKYIQVGKSVFCRINITLGNTSSMGSGAATFTLPVTSVSPLNNDPAGTVAIRTSNGVIGFIEISSTTTARIVAGGASTYITELAFTSSVPGTWGNNSQISGYFMYEAA